ncbi:DUF3685 domain-containing protein [Oculatella sp. LEGE 06141]|uniref:DUF3685 domain-containing protein n=1 Tax=Oculatella sp. LEGE 06141 TaxID=1828648 RepID=UPI0018818C9E|nr:DUF3685 domain-containing protein [Oculatella sp. LEGE 06141]MBE9181767.1 DUF3685 domain-containing protein [Oculatella sp. LEGE 06141]
MSDRTASPEERLPSNLIIVDHDPVFRLGLRIWLNRFPDLNVVAEAENGETALQVLATCTEPSNPVAIDLVILDLTLGQFDPAQMQGFAVCQQIRATYPDVSILLLSSATEPLLLAAAQQAGATGYCPKSADVEDLTTIIRRVAAGERCWIQPFPGGSRSITGEPPRPNRSTGNEPGDRQPLTRPPNSFAILRRNLRRSGLQRIDAAIADVVAQLQNLNLSDLDRAVVAGRYRELRAARWLVNQLLATPTVPESEPEATTAPTAPTDISLPPSAAVARPNRSIQPIATASEPIALQNTIVTAQSLQAVLFDAVLAKLQTGLDNQTNAPLEIDILREERKRELFYLILRKLEGLLNELRYSQIEPTQIIEKRSSMLRDVWQAAATDFFGKYYAVPIDNQSVEVVSALLQEESLVQTEILDRIPLVVEFFNHLLFQTPLEVDGTAYVAGNPESLARAELILDHLVIQVANAIVQPLLNRFANVEIVKQTFYDRRLRSIRELERFRNNLSWHYRVEQLFRDPQNIFESQYRLFTFTGRGIKQRLVYAPRTRELEQLSGVRLAVTILLEARDAIAPRLRSTISLVGNGVIYVLTEVIGRGIGLIGRGIIKGIGNTWQDSRYSRK